MPAGWRVEQAASAAVSAGRVWGRTSDLDVLAKGSCGVLAGMGVHGALDVNRNFENLCFIDG